MKIKLVGLPHDCHAGRIEVKIEEDGMYHEDIFQITLKNGIVVDAGQYGINKFFNVMVISKSDWNHPVESCICKTIQDMADTTVKLANKYNEEWYGQIALEW